MTDLSNIKREQCRELIKWFDSGMEITVIGAAIQLGIGALNRRLTDLEEQGYPIKREWREYVNSKGQLKRRMHYSKWFGPDFDIDAELKGIEKAFASLKR